MAEDQEFTLPPLEERPLVTFALFAYNQEKYIREAVEGAFAQTYEPLEIILSDDCSTDRTFEIMEEMASRYKGAHRIILNRTKHNKGTLAHVLDAVSRSSGKIFVLAAGDDISLPNRTFEIARAWNKSNAWGMYSHFQLINENSELIPDERVELKSGDGLKTLKSYFYIPDVKLVHGATSAYDRRLFLRLIDFNTEGIFAEDGVLSFLLNIESKPIVKIEKPLVQYRTHDASLSNTGSQSTTIEEITNREIKSVLINKQFILFNNLIKSIALKKDVNFKKKVNFFKIDSTSLILELKADWFNLPFLKKLSLLHKARNSQDVKWFLSRIFGIKVFSTAKFAWCKLSRRSLIR